MDIIFELKLPTCLLLITISMLDSAHWCPSAKDLHLSLIYWMTFGNNQSLQCRINREKRAELLA